MNAATIVRNGAIGAVSGLAASFIMSEFQSGWSAVRKKLQPQDQGSSDGGEEPSTEKAADRMAQATSGRPVAGQDKGAAGQAVHYGFGTLLGAIYGTASTAAPAIRAGFGMPFGAAVWAGGDETLLPATGLAKRPDETPLSTHAYALISHLVFGASLEGGRRLLDRGVGALADGSRGRRR